MDGSIYSLVDVEDIQQTASLSLRGKFSWVRTMATDIGSAAKHSKGNIRDEASGGIGFFEAI